MATTTSQINEIKEDLSDAYTALGAKGATLPAANARGSANLASTVATVPSAGYPNLAFNLEGGVASAFHCELTDSSFDGVTALGDKVNYVAPMEKTFQGKSSNLTGVVNFRNLTTVNKTDAFYNCFDSTYISSVNMSALETITGDGSFNYAFKSCPKLTTASFPSLTTVSGDRCFNNTFESCTALTTVSFPSLTRVYGHSSFGYVFKECTSLTTISFPELTEIGSSYISLLYSFSTAFESCTALTTVSFPKLTKIYDKHAPSVFAGCTSLNSVDFSKLQDLGNGALAQAFYGCTGLTTISFPALTSFASKALMSYSSGGYCFTNCTNLTEIHFPSAMQSTIEASTGYSSKFGATNATIYFDL